MVVFGWKAFLSCIVIGGNRVSLTFFIVIIFIQWHCLCAFNIIEAAITFSGVFHEGGLYNIGSLHLRGSTYFS